MDYRISGTGKMGFGAVIAFSRQIHRRLIHALGLAICIAGIMIVFRVVQSAAVQQPSTADALDGTWDLDSLNGDAVGEKSPSPVLSQRISFRDGKLRGETLIRANTAASTSAMPFPDESVTRVISNADETGIRVLWTGTYERGDNQQLALHIGKAVYFVKVAKTSDTNSFELNQDIILTIRGTARYHRAVSMHPPQ